MASSRLFSSIVLLLLTLFSYNLSVRASDDDRDDYDQKARVARISLINGEVNLKRKSSNDWEKARLNFPLVEGDTLTTDRDSRLEIQIDSRNFVRLAENTEMQIVALRDEGVAISLISGTTTVRIARFDAKHEYFEIDAPRSTLAIEKKGLYRVDAPPSGRVRLAVRDGGSARIYSDTSGFALRDGRTAELIVDGSNSGDWDFVADNRDGIDDWVKDREKYLTQRLRYDTQYYDEYVWGAEDLDAYGDWSYTGDYGWIWRPRGTFINVYDDWAPYRYGHWVWCPPYGWTWVGYEPWGWAPYHYGRWVFTNGYWAWCPRSAFYHERNWWRPALVAFVVLDNNYCWYPLGYHQHDPHSRYYHDQSPARLTALRAEELANLRRVNPVQLRAVTSANARDLGNENSKPSRADDALARRVLGSEPSLNGLPARTARADSDIARPARPAVMVTPPATGAATRTPGVPLDSELRRTRVLNGREARPARQTADTSAGTNVETRPTGAVTRPSRSSESTGVSEPRPERRPVVTNESQPASSDSGDKPTRNRERVEPARPERRDDSPSSTPSYEPPQRSAPPSRVESPRVEAPRSESARPSRSDSSDRPSRSESPRSEPSRSESPRSESPRSEPTRSEPSRSEPSRSEPSRSEPARSEPSRSEPSRSAPARDPDSGRPSRPKDPRR